MGLAADHLKARASMMEARVTSFRLFFLVFADVGFRPIEDILEKSASRHPVVCDAAAQGEVLMSNENATAVLSGRGVTCPVVG